jgi:hypothetical protein
MYHCIMYSTGGCSAAQHRALLGTSARRSAASQAARSLLVTLRRVSKGGTRSQVPRL